MKKSAPKKSTKGKMPKVKGKSLGKPNMMEINMGKMPGKKKY